MLLNTIVNGITLIRAGKNIYEYVTGTTLGNKIDNYHNMISLQIEELSKNIYFSKIEEVYNIAKNNQEKIDKIDKNIESIKMFQQQIDSNILLSRPIIIPGKFLSRVHEKEESLFSNIMPITKTVDFYNDDPTLIPVFFEKWGIYFVGYIKRAYANDYLDIKFVPNREIMQLFCNDKDEKKEIVNDNNIKRCPNCNSYINDKWKICIKCGKKLKLKCIKCNTWYELGVDYCPECGNAISEKAIEEELCKVLEKINQKMIDKIKQNRSGRRKLEKIHLEGDIHDRDLIDKNYDVLEKVVNEIVESDCVGDYHGEIADEYFGLLVTCTIEKSDAYINYNLKMDDKKFALRSIKNSIVIAEEAIKNAPKWTVPSFENIIRHLNNKVVDINEDN